MTTSSTTDLAGVAQRAVRRRGDAQDPTAVPEISDLVEVRGQRWVVADVDLGESEKPDGRSSRGTTLVTLNSVEDGRYNDTLSVIWEVEPGRRRLPAGSLPDVTAGGFDPPERLAAFLDAVRWSAVTSADVRGASYRHPDLHRCTRRRRHFGRPRFTRRTGDVPGALQQNNT